MVNKMKSYIKEYILSLPCVLVVLLLISLVWLGVYYGVLNKLPEPFPSAGKVGTFLEAIMASYICSCIFYFITFHSPSVLNLKQQNQIVKQITYLVAHRFSRVLNSIDIKLINNIDNENEFIAIIKGSVWRNKGVLLQTNAFGSGFYTKQFPEAIVDFKNMVTSRIRTLPLESRNKLAKLEFNVLWEYLEETDILKLEQPTIGEFYAKRLYEVKNIIEEYVVKYEIQLKWNDMPAAQFRQYK